MDIDLLKLGPLLLGAAGTTLGIYNLLTARHERRQKSKHGFALMLLYLDPIVDKLLAIPLRQPTDLATLEATRLLESLGDLNGNLEQGHKELITLVPEIAGRILDLRHASNELQIRLNEPATLPVALAREVADFYHSAWTLAYFRTMAKYFDIELHGQSTSSLENWIGDEKVQCLNARWEAFFRASRHHDA